MGMSQQLSFGKASLLLALFLSGLKLLLMPAYKSTDFEVHRNWLAITHSLPMRQWYLESTSIWTLDYPPLFAWFEWCMSLLAARVDPKMVEIRADEYASWATVIFQRTTVIVTDAALFAAALIAARSQSQHPGRGAWVTRNGMLVLFLVTANAGLLVVDHIHFQYNGVMLGLLLLSALAAESGNDLLSALLFAALLNMKHIFAYSAPLYFVYMLRHYCVGRPTKRLFRFLSLGGIVAGVCGVSMGPFVALGQLKQVLSRLFPFGRGLTHSYWAPNFWAMYSAADKVLSGVLRKLGRPIEEVPGNMAGGIVGVSKFLALPQVPPSTTMLLVLLAILPCLVATWKRPRPSAFARAVAYCNLCGFMFGYHVHEKAILPVVLPLSLVATSTPTDALHFLLLITAGHYGLLPLLFHPAEYPIKLLLVLLYCLTVLHGFSNLRGWSRVEGLGSQSQRQGHGQRKEEDQSQNKGQSQRQGQSQKEGQSQKQGQSRKEGQGQQQGQSMNVGSKGGGDETGQGLVLGWVPRAYLLGFVGLEVYCSWVHEAVWRGRLPFVPLMLTSLYCSVGIGAVWVSMVWRYAAEALSRDKGKEE